MNYVLPLVVLVSLTLLTTGIAQAETAPKTVETSFDVAPVWAGHPVGFALLSSSDKQYVAFYDAERKMTVGARKLSEQNWHFVKLPETVGWDSHNYIAMAMDDEGYLHLSGNMHAGPMVYFRTAKPGDIDSFERVPMVGRDEERSTYPQFLRGPQKQFIFTYRSGYSGNGDQIYNVYDHKTKTWSRLTDQPLTDGEGHMNAYFARMRQGADGYYHLAWVWRDTGDCQTNHHLSYARSKDWVHWENSAGKLIALPMTIKTAEIIDPVPVKGGMINGNVAIGFDSKGRVIVSYHKFDEKGFTQIYGARREEDGWKLYRTSSWEYRWEFQGGGSIPFEIGLGAVGVAKDGRLIQTYSHIKYGKGEWTLDEKTLKPISDIKQAPVAAASASAQGQPKPAELELAPRTAGDSGSTGEPGVRYMLRWETLGANRDHPREGTPPPPSMLKLIRIETISGEGK